MINKILSIFNLFDEDEYKIKVNNLKEWSKYVNNMYVLNNSIEEYKRIEKLIEDAKEKYPKEKIDKMKKIWQYQQNARKV